MLDGDKLKFGDLLMQKPRNGSNSLFMFLQYCPKRMNVKLLKIPRNIYIPSVPVWKPDYESFLDSLFVRHHGIFRPISDMDYADLELIEKHNGKANHFLNLGKWLYNCSLYPKINSVDEWLDSDGAKKDALTFKNGCYITVGGRGCGKSYYADRIHEKLKRIRENSHYGLCCPSELIDKYKEEETKKMGKTPICGKVELTADLYLKGRTPDYDKPIYANVFAYNDFSGIQIDFKLSDGRYARTYVVRIANVNVCAAYFSGEALFTFMYNCIYNQTDGQIIINNTLDNISRLRRIIEEYGTFKDREEVKEEYTYDRNLTGRVIRQSGVDYVIGSYGFDEKHYDDAKKVRRRLLAYKVPNEYTSDTFASMVKRYSREDLLALTSDRGLFYDTYDDGRIVVPCFVFVNKKTEEKKETTEMKGFNELFTKGTFGSKVYIQTKDSDKVTYAGTMTDMNLETALGCELHGHIDFVVDDAPVEKLANFDRSFIKNVVFHDPATIVEWKDGTKTVVQVRDGEKFDPEKGLAMAICKKAMGNKRDYYHVFKHYLKKVKTEKAESVCGEDVKTVMIPGAIADDVMKYIADTFCEKIDEVSIAPETIEEVKRYEEDK